MLRSTTICHKCPSSWNAINSIRWQYPVLATCHIRIMFVQQSSTQLITSYAAQVQTSPVAVQFVLQMQPLKWICVWTAKHHGYTVEHPCSYIAFLCQTVSWWPSEHSCIHCKAYKLAQAYQWKSYRKCQGIVVKYARILVVNVGHLLWWGFRTTMDLNGWNCRFLCLFHNASIHCCHICLHSSEQWNRSPSAD